MTSPISGLAATIYAAMKDIFLDATLARDALTTGSPDVSFDPSAVTTTSYSCKAIRDTFSKYEMASNLVKVGDVKILILEGSLSVTPQSQDRITISSETFTIKQVDTDPATAVWVCTASK